MMLADAYTEHGDDVHEAVNVLEAVAIIGTHDLAAVITDIDMPGGLSGLDLAAMLSQCQPALPVILTSGGQTVADGVLPPAAKFVSKPYGMERVIYLAQSMIAAALVERSKALAS